MAKKGREEQEQKEQEGLTPVNAILPGMEDLEVLSPVLRKIEQSKSLTKQGQHHFTRHDQIEALREIGEDPNADMGFMTRLLTLCSLPRTDPGTQLQYKRQNGPYKLVMIAGGDNKLPFGNLPRLLLAWVSTEAYQTQSRDLVLGKSLLVFMKKLGLVSSNSGGEYGNRTRLRRQMDRLFNAHVQLIYEVPGHKVTTSSAVAERTEFWWNHRIPEQDTLWGSRIRLGEEFFNEIIANPVPLDMRILKKMQRSSLGLDLYMWLSYKTHSLYRKSKKPQRLTWERLYIQFGANPQKASDESTVQNFRTDVIRELKKLKLAWPGLDYGTPSGYLEIRPCPPSIKPKSIDR